jgi:hypothetical protein
MFIYINIYILCIYVYMYHHHGVINRLSYPLQAVCGAVGQGCVVVVHAGTYQSPESGRDCVKSLRSSYTGLCPQSA